MIKPMLAGKCDDVHALNYSVLASPKLDGIRALVVDGVVMSRKMLPIPNGHIQRTFGLKKYNGLDGELMVGAATNAFIAGTEGIMRKEGKPDVTFNVFDNYLEGNKEFFDRYTKVQSRFEGHRTIKPVQHVHVGTPGLLTTLEEEWLEAGFEGLMIRDPRGPYKHGRSTAREGWLLKLKRFEDSEALIVGFKELQHNENEKVKDKLGNAKRSGHKAGKVAGGMLGAFIVQDIVTGVEFDVGSGFTEEQRIKYWRVRDSLLNLIIKYRYFPTGSKDKPRFPTFQGFRDPRDM